MAGYRIEFEPSALKALRRVTRSDQRRIIARVEALASEPRPPGCEKLEGYGGYRIRSGDYRVVYRIDDGDRIVTITRVGHRKEVYRGL